MRRRHADGRIWPSFDAVEAIFAEVQPGGESPTEADIAEAFGPRERWDERGPELVEASRFEGVPAEHLAMWQVWGPPRSPRSTR